MPPTLKGRVLSRIEGRRPLPWLGLVLAGGWAAGLELLGLALALTALQMGGPVLLKGLGRGLLALWPLIRPFALLGALAAVGAAWAALGAVTAIAVGFSALRRGSRAL